MKSVAGGGEKTEVQARGELQLGILIENMRREGMELSVSPPQVKISRGSGTSDVSIVCPFCFVFQSMPLSRGPAVRAALHCNISEVHMKYR